MHRLTRPLAVLAFAALPMFAADTTPAEQKPKPYPLTTCLVSGEQLGTMGEPVTQIQNGQEVKFCCKGCVKDFTKDPAKYMSKLDAASKAKPAAAGHDGHDHAH